MSATNLQPSFYYLLIAKTCFQRSRVAGDRARSAALSEIGRGYLIKAERDTRTPAARPEN